MFNFCEDFVGRTMVTDAGKSNTCIAGSNSKPHYYKQKKTMKELPENMRFNGRTV